MSSFRELMRGKPEAFSACRHCAKAIERRGSIWYASGEAAAADICRKVPSGEHKPIK